MTWNNFCVKPHFSDSSEDGEFPSKLVSIHSGINLTSAIAVIGFALGGAGVVLCCIIAITCISWKKRNMSTKQGNFFSFYQHWHAAGWKRLGTDDPDMELLADYDEDAH